MKNLDELRVFENAQGVKYAAILRDSEERAAVLQLYGFVNPEEAAPLPEAVREVDDYEALILDAAELLNAPTPEHEQSTCDFFLRPLATFTKEPLYVVRPKMILTHGFLRECAKSLIANGRIIERFFADTAAVARYRKSRLNSQGRVPFKSLRSL